MKLRSDSAYRARPLVVLVHGLWMHGSVCAIMAARLRACGFRPALFSYRSVSQPLDEISHRLAGFVEARRPERVHFVGHSLGGLVVLNLLALGLAARVGRVILLGSPVLGCSAAEQLLPSRAGRLLLGRALLQWRRERAQQAVSRLEVGAIAGTGRMGIGSLLVRLSGQNDGVVTVEETRVPGLADHIVLPVSHSGMIVSARVAREVCHFLHHGRFARA